MKYMGEQFKRLANSNVQHSATCNNMDKSNFLFVALCYTLLTAILTHPYVTLEITKTKEIHVLIKMSLNNLGDDNVMTVW